MILDYEEKVCFNMFLTQNVSLACQCQGAPVIAPTVTTGYPGDGITGYPGDGITGYPGDGITGYPGDGIKRWQILISAMLH